jgi:hypothetical protein
VQVQKQGGGLARTLTACLLVFVAAATLASLAGNEMVASFIMDAPADSVAKTLLTLLEV